MYQRSCHSQTIKIIGTDRVGKEVHEWTCANKDYDEGGGNPERTIEVRFIFKDDIEWRSEEDGRPDSCKDGFLFNIEIVSEYIREYLACRQKKKSNDFYLLLTSYSSYSVFPDSKEVNRFICGLLNI